MILLACGTAGCWQPPGVTMLEERRGLVWMFPGVEGQPWSLQGAFRASREGGVDSAIRVFDWERPGKTFENLTDLAGNRAKAAVVADDIRAYRTRNPDTRIDLVGYSGGAGIALFVAENLAGVDSPADPSTPDGGPAAPPMPDCAAINNIVLVQPAISPDYDLSRVAPALRGRIVNFYCPQDWFILGWGTTVFGTMDRRHCASAGKNGFDVAKAMPAAAARDKLVQIPWTTAMIAEGHGGDHIGGLWYSWNRKYVVPYLREAE